MFQIFRVLELLLVECHLPAFINRSARLGLNWIIILLGCLASDRCTENGCGGEDWRSEQAGLEVSKRRGANVEETMKAPVHMSGGFLANDNNVEAFWCCEKWIINSLEDPLSLRRFFPGAVFQCQWGHGMNVPQWGFFSGSSLDAIEKPMGYKKKENLN